MKTTAHAAKSSDSNDLTFPHEVPCGSVVVKIYRVKNKAFKGSTEERFSYMVSYSAGGKRTQKMFADFDDAEAYAKSVGKSMSRGELDVLELRSADRIAYVHAMNELRPLGVSLEWAVKEYAEASRLLGGKASLVEAAREYAEAMRVLGDKALLIEAVREFERRRLHQVASKTVLDAVEEMIAAKERENLSEVHLKGIRRHLREFAKVCASEVRHIATNQVSDFLRALQTGSEQEETLRAATARTKNNYRATLGNFFNYCKERNWVSRDHEGIEFIPKFKEKGGDIEILTVREMSQYLAHARAEIIPFLAIGGFAGLRTAEIARLDWSEVHLADRFIEVKADKAKTASRRIVPIADNLAAWLKDYAQESGRVMPFDHISKQIGWLVDDVNKALKDEAKQAGQDQEKAPQVKWKHNGLRHSFISYRVAEIQNANQVALEAGNSPAMIFKHYRELVRPVEAVKWFAVRPAKAKQRTVKPASLPKLRVLPEAAAA